MVDNCLFCKIASGEISAEIVFTDEQVVAFKDIDPQAPVHILIIPRKHIASMNDIVVTDNVLIGHMHMVAQQLAEQLGIADAGYRLINNCNDDGGQAIDHLHYHLLGGRRMTWPPG